MKTISMKHPLLASLLCVGGLVLVSFLIIFTYAHRNELKNMSFVQASSQKSVQKASQQKLICLIDSYPSRFPKQIDIITKTWAKRCDYAYIISTVANETKGFNVIEYKGEDSDHWGKVMVSLDYVYNNYIDKIDWVLKTSDEVFTIPENLHYFINSKKLKSSDPLWFGSEYLSPSKSVFMSREGYVMSKAAVVKLMTEGKKLPKDKCKTQEHQLNEEDELAKCLKALDVKTVDTRDQLGRHRFISYDLGEMIIPVSDPNKREKRLRFPYQNGPNCCAQDPILLKGGSIRFFDFMLYELHYAGEK
uniref:Glycoprotein-N-acetylgalactosamine 3-beta-galactosyltransferase 1 n=1 Tax=Lepeophtheirus salmonis TaxID=72036 RepID=A0A0K2TPC6_LEPSM